MAFLTDVRRQSFEKLFNNHWMRFFYDEPRETWQEKYRSFISGWWNRSAILVESKARQFFDHWYICVVVIAVTLIVLTIYKSRRYLGTIKFREKVYSEIQIGEQTCSVDEETVIVPKVCNEDDEERRDETFVKPCPTFPSDLHDSTITRDNDQVDYQTESSISSEATIIPDTFQNEMNQFLKSFIDSMEPGEDSIESPDSLDQRDSILEKVDSENRKKFYVLTPWVDGVEEECLSEKSNDEKSKIKNLNRVSQFDSIIGDKLTSKNDNLIKNASEDSSLLTEISKKPISSNFDESNPENNRVTTLEDIVKKSLESSTTNSNEECEKFFVANDSTKFKLTEDNTELPRSRNSRRTIAINNKESIDSRGLEIQSESKHRFRSLSYDDRSVSSSVNLDTRRGGSVSPPLRNKNKLRSTKQGQSKIPTLSPPAFMNSRSLGHYESIDGSISEASDQIRGALLRKLREVWAQHSRDASQLSNRLKNSSPLNGSSIDSKLVDLGSKIPLPRKFSKGRPFH